MTYDIFCSTCMRAGLTPLLFKDCEKCKKILTKVSIEEWEAGQRQYWRALERAYKEVEKEYEELHDEL